MCYVSQPIKTLCSCKVTLPYILVGQHSRKANQALPTGSFERSFPFVACMDAGKGREQDAEALLNIRLDY